MQVNRNTHFPGSLSVQVAHISTAVHVSLYTNVQTFPVISYSGLLLRNQLVSTVISSL